MSWRKRINTLTMTLVEFNKGFTKKPLHINHEIGTVCKPMEKGTGNTIGVSNRVKIVEVEIRQRYSVVRFEHVCRGDIV